jgi:inner membrane protein
MDNLTHSLTGLMLARAGLDRFTPRATLILMLAANAPDIDVVSLMAGADKYLHYHRWLTHAIVLAPVMALLPVLIAWIFRRNHKIRWLPAYLISLIGVATHLLLDWTNFYGIRLLLPFRQTWYKLETTAIIDPWIWTVLLLACLGPLLSRLVSSEIGARPAKGRGGAIAALAFILLYNGTRYTLHERAVALQEGRVYDGATPRRVSAQPSALNPMLWRGLVETDSAFIVQTVNLTTDFDPGAGRQFYKPEQTPAMQAAAQTEVFRNLMDFSDFVLWRATPAPEPAGAQQVELIDLRFSAPPAPRFTAMAIVDSQLHVIRSWFAF